MHDPRRSTFMSDVAFVSSFTSPPKANLPRPSGTLSIAKFDTIRPPRRPLPPQKLAKLANALGVITPIPIDFTPVSKHPQFLQSISSSDSRSPTIVTPTSASYPNVKYVIHVVPPSHFPHPLEDDPEGQATFRRGLLVPLRPTLKGQVSAIAREYKMPSTSGITLYLVGTSEENSISGPGPRITEDVWKLFGTVVSNEVRESDTERLGISSEESTSTLTSPLRELTTSSPGISLTSANHKGEFLTGDESSRSRSPESFAPTNSGLNSDSSNPLTLSSQRLVSQFLPGLKSSSIIPILAKVEFDVDRKLGGWYEAWSRSRRSRQLLIGHPKQDLLLEDRSSAPHQNTSSPQVSAELVLDNKSGGLSDGQFSNNISPVTNGIESSPLVKEFNDADNSFGQISNLPNALESDLDSDALGYETSNPEENESIPSNSVEKSLRRNAPPPVIIPERFSDATPAFKGSTSLARESFQSGILYGSGQSAEHSMDDFSRADFVDERRVGGIYDDIEFDFNLTDMQDNSEDEEHNLNDARWHQLRMRKELDILEKNIAQLSPRQLRSTDVRDRDSPQSGSSNSDITVPHLQNIRARSSSLRATKKGLPSYDGAPLMPAFQHLPRARPSTEIEEDVIATPPIFRQPVLVGTPSPVLPSFRENERDWSEHGLTSDSVIYTELDSNNLGQRTSGGSHPSWPSIPFASLRDRDEIILPPQASSRSLHSLSLKKPLPQLIIDEGNGGIQATGNGHYFTSVSGTSAGSSSDTLGPSRMTSGISDSIDTILLPSLTRRESGSAELSPIIPLSPDPFGRIPSSDLPKLPAMPSNRSWFKGRGDEVKMTEQTPNNMETGVEALMHASKPPSSLSRFSADSVTEDDKARGSKDRSTLKSVKSIRRLWRKSNKSISSISTSTMPALNIPQNSNVNIDNKDSYTSSTPPVPGITFDRSNDIQPVRHTRSDSALDPFHFDQTSNYKGSPPRLSSDSNTPTQSSSTSSYSKSSTISTAASSSYELITGTSKSILKSWNTTTGSSPYLPDHSDHVVDHSSIGRRRPSESEMADDISHRPIGPITALKFPPEYGFDQHSHAIQNRSATFSRKKPAPSSSTDSQTSSPSIATPVTSSSSPRIGHMTISLSPRVSEDSNIDRLPDLEIVTSQSKPTDTQSPVAYSMI